MSLLSLPDEILLNYIFSRDNLTTTDLFRLILSCRRLHNVIVDSNQLWMSKCSSRWIEMHNQFHGKNKVVWKDWVFSQRVLEEVNNTVTNLSSQCYPFGKLVGPLDSVENWIIGSGYPNFVCAENELLELLFTESISVNLTLSHYASAAFDRLVTCLQVKNLNTFMAKPESQKALLEGAKLVSKWFHFNGNSRNKTKKLVDNVEQNLDKIAERVQQLVKKSKSEALKDILKCINKVVFDEMSFRVFNNNDIVDHLNQPAASIHKVLEKRLGYPEVLCVIYLEVATRMGITCKPIHLDCLENSILSCQVEGVVDVFYISVCSRGFFDLPSIHPSLINQPACSFEVLFKQMLKSVVARDRSWANIRSSIRLLCVLSKVNVIKQAESFLKVDDGAEDAYLLLLSAEVDSNEPVMISCAQKLNSQQSQINEAKVARHRVPSINYAVGLVMNMTLDITRPKHCVILSWDECFREEGSRQKWGLSFIRVTNGYRLDQPFYHIIQFETSHFWRIALQGETEKNLYVPQEFLQLHDVGIYHDLEMPPIDGLGIYFELFDGRRYVPNAEHKAHFPDDNAAALSLIQQI